MDQAVYAAIFLIKAGDQLPEHGFISRLVRTVDPVRDEIGELHKPARSAINEERGFSVGGERADSRARGGSPLPPAQHGRLNGGLELEATLVGDHDAAMAVAARGEPAEHPVAPREELLVGALVRVVVRKGIPVEDDGEERRRPAAAGQIAEQEQREVVNEPVAPFLIEAMPDAGPRPQIPRVNLRIPQRTGAGRTDDGRSAWPPPKGAAALAACMAMFGQPRARCQARRAGGGRRIDQRRKRSSMRACPSRAIRSSRIRRKSSRVRPPIWLAWHSTASSHRSRCSVTSTV